MPQLKQPKQTSPRNSQAGQIVLISIVLFAILLTLSAVLFGSVAIYLKAERQTVARAQALQLAEAAVDQAIYQLNQASSYTGETDTTLGAGTFTISVSNIDSATKAITATGAVPN